MFQAPTPHPSPRAGHQLYHLLILLSFKTHSGEKSSLSHPPNWSSSSSSYLIKSLSSLLLLNAKSPLSWNLTLLGSGGVAQSSCWLTDNDWVKHAPFHLEELPLHVLWSYLSYRLRHYWGFCSISYSIVLPCNGFLKQTQPMPWCNFQH